MRKHLHTHGPRVHVCAECGKVKWMIKLQPSVFLMSTGICGEFKTQEAPVGSHW